MSWNGSALLKRKSFETESPVWLWMCLLRVALSYSFASICSWSGYTITLDLAPNPYLFFVFGGREGQVQCDSQSSLALLLCIYTTANGDARQKQTENKGRDHRAWERREKKETGGWQKKRYLWIPCPPQCPPVKVWFEVIFLSKFFFSSGYTFNFTIDGQITVVK